MPKDFVPENDGELEDWINNLDDWVQEYGADAGLSDAQIERSALLRADWNSSYGAVSPALTAYEGAVAAKIGAGKSYIALARGLVGQLQANPDTDDEQRSALRIPIRKTTRTAPKTPASVPICDITSSRLRHSLSFRDEHHTTRRAKPAGARGCQIWIFITPVRGLGFAEMGEFRFLAEATRTPFVHDFSAEWIGQTAYYQLRWVNSRSEAGPWSGIFSAMIGA